MVGDDAARHRLGQMARRAHASGELERGTVREIAPKTMLIYFTSGTTSMKMVERDFSYGLAHEITRRYWMI